MRRYCPACGEDTLHSFRLRKWGFEIERCERCGLGCTVLPAGFDPLTIYDDSYFLGGRRDGYQNYPATAEVLRAEARSILAHLARSGVRSGRLLEIGCAFGFFLAEAQERFECSGIEVNEAAVEHCRARGLAVQCAPVSPEALSRSRGVDVVVMLDVIEHLAAPDADLAAIRETLRPGGHLLVTTGDWGSAVSRITGTHWRLLTPPQHLFYFTESSLRHLLSRLGFEVVDCVRPAKTVPVALIAFQALGERVPRRWLGRLQKVGVRVNLFDAMRLVCRRA